MLLYLWVVLILFLFITLNQRVYTDKKLLWFGITGFILFGVVLEVSCMNPSLFVRMLSVAGLMLASGVVASRI